MIVHSAVINKRDAESLASTNSDAAKTDDSRLPTLPRPDIELIWKQPVPLCRPVSRFSIVCPPLTNNQCIMQQVSPPTTDFTDIFNTSHKKH